MKNMTEKNKKTLKILLVVLAVAAVTALVMIMSKPLVNLVSSPQSFRDWVASHGAWSRIAYIGMVILQITVALIPGEPFEIAAGYAFGVVEGTALCMLAASIGSILVFFAVRVFGMRLVKIFFSEEKLGKVEFLKSTPGRNIIFAIIFILPGTPKDLLCYFAGLTDIKFPLWLMICTLGRFPSVVTSTLSGDALGTKDYFLAAVVFGVTLMISAGGILIYDRICKRNGAAEKAEKIPQKEDEN